MEGQSGLEMGVGRGEKEGVEGGRRAQEWKYLSEKVETGLVGLGTILKSSDVAAGREGCLYAGIGKTWSI